jgi:hypothetical protein
MLCWWLSGSVPIEDSDKLGAPVSRIGRGDLKTLPAYGKEVVCSGYTEPFCR